MTLVLRINLLMLVTFVIGTGFLLLALQGLAPPRNWWLAVAAYAVFTGYAGIRLARVARNRLSEAAHLDGNLLLDERMIWFANLPIVAVLWLLHPYGSDTLLLVGLIMSMTATSGFMICTITRPPRRRLIWAAPSVISVSNALYVVVHATPYWFILAGINLSLCASFLLAKWQLQEVLHAAWQAKQAAEAARDGRTRFLAAASHDLGQPLQAARLFAAQAMGSATGPARERAQRGLDWAFDATEQLLGQMLDHLRLEAGQVEARLAPLALGPVLAELAERHEPAARLAGLAISALPSRLEVTADRALLDRALGNLVGNAIRHAKARRVLVAARRHAGRVRIWVIDDGVGIPAVDAPRLFDDHFQGSNHGDEIRGGFGLGLASTRRLAEVMAGRAGYDPRWRRGSAFWVELPVA
jgi:signal transduction histidine kinase